MSRRSGRDWAAVDQAILRVLTRARAPLSSSTIWTRSGVPRLHFDIRLQALKRRGLIRIAYGRTTASRWVAIRPGTPEPLTVADVPGSIGGMGPDDQAKPTWMHDPTDDQRYPRAVDGKCPADGGPLSTDPKQAVQSGIDYCAWCRRCYFRENGRRVERTWWSGRHEAPNPSNDELRFLLVMVLRSACPHPVEHPAMWRAWGEACKRVGLNPDDYRIPTRDEALARRLEGAEEA